MKKIILLFITSLIVLTVGFFIITSPGNKLSTAQKEAALTNMLGRKPILNDKAVARGNIQFKGKDLTLMYPARARLYVLRVNGVVKKDNWNLDSLNFDLDDPRMTVLITVSNAPESVKDITDYPSVKLRMIQPGMYQQKDISIDGHKGFVFDKQDNSGFEKTAFIYSDSKIYLFSVSGSDTAAIEELFKKIIASVKFL